MRGPGSLNHNRRSFTAENVDPKRSSLNVVYRDEPIQKVYHELFDEAVKRYNAKQKRKDRCINDYYGITLLFKSWLYSTFLLVRGTLHTINVNRGDCVACVISKCA